jgi:predicted nucleic acid-binding protein
VRADLAQLRRTASLQAEADALVALTIRAVEAAREGLEAVPSRLSAAAEVLPVDASTLAEAERVRAAYRLQLPDAIMLAALLHDPKLGSEPSAFVNKNSKDFGDPGSRGGGPSLAR